MKDLSHNINIIKFCRELTRNKDYIKNLKVIDSAIHLCLDKDKYINWILIRSHCRQFISIEHRIRGDKYKFSLQDKMDMADNLLEHFKGKYK